MACSPSSGRWCRTGASKKRCALNRGEPGRNERADRGVARRHAAAVFHSLRRVVCDFIERLAAAAFGFLRRGGPRTGPRPDGLGVSMPLSQSGRRVGRAVSQAPAQPRRARIRGQMAGERIRTGHSRHRPGAGPARLRHGLPGPPAAAHGERVGTCGACGDAGLGAYREPDAHLSSDHVVAGEGILDLNRGPGHPRVRTPRRSSSAHRRFH